jgi:hypothetical protein
MKRSHILLAVIAVAVAFHAGKLLGTTKTVITTKIPENFYCQPFRDPKSQEAQDFYIKQMKAEPVMFQMLSEAFKAQSRGEGSVIEFNNYVCAEVLGQFNSARAKTYYYVKR